MRLVILVLAALMLGACGGNVQKQAWTSSLDAAEAAEYRDELSTAAELYAKSLAEARANLGKEEISSSLYNLGRVYRKQKNYTKAIALLEESVNIERSIKPVREDTLDRRLMELATALHLSGSYKQAMPVFDELMSYAMDYSGIKKQLLMTLYREFGEALNAAEMTQEGDKYIAFSEAMTGTKFTAK